MFGLEPAAELGIAAVVGMVVMYVIIYMFPGLLPESYFRSVFEEMKRRRKKQKIAAAGGKEATLEERIKAATSESYRVAIAQNDVERGVTLMVVKHIEDMVEDVQRLGRIKHLIQLVFLGYNSDTPLWRREDLVAHVHRIYEEAPALPFFLEERSVPDFFKIFYTAEKGQPPPGVDEPPLPTFQQFHDRFIREGREFFESLGTEENRQKLDAIADACVERLEKAMKPIFDEREAQAAAAAEQQAAAQS